MAIVAKNSLVLSPATPASSLLAAKRPPAPPMNQADPDPANADSSDVSVEAASTGTGSTAAPTTRSLSKVSSAGASANEDAGNDENDTPRSTASSNPPARQRKYERKTKRFIWPEELHRLFVAAIFDGEASCVVARRLLHLLTGVVVVVERSWPQECVSEGASSSTLQCLGSCCLVFIVC